MDTKTLNTLLYAKEGPCVSLIIPTNRIGTARMQNTTIIRKAIAKAKDILDNRNLAPEKRELLWTSLELLITDIDETSLLDGLGVFVSPQVSKLIFFPFPVQEKVIVDDSFETRDILNLQQFISPYHVLVITKNIIRLYMATADTLEEIKDGHFPMKYEDEYEYTSPSPGTSYGSSLKAYEKDKGILTNIRFRSTLKLADDMLGDYLKSPESAIILTGTKNLMADFENLTSHKQKIVGKIAGSFGEENFSELTQSSWYTFISHRKAENKLLIERLNEKRVNEVVYGIRDVWKAAEEGKGLMLLVEVDYRHRAYKKEGDFQIHLSPEKGYVTISDAVDDVIETVYRKKGKVVFVDNKELENFDHIALILRYA